MKLERSAPDVQWRDVNEEGEEAGELSRNGEFLRHQGFINPFRYRRERPCGTSIDPPDSHARSAQNV